MIEAVVYHDFITIYKYKYANPRYSNYLPRLLMKPSACFVVSNVGSSKVAYFIALGLNFSAINPPARDAK
jgi:hypothetical protein